MPSPGHRASFSGMTGLSAALMSTYPPRACGLASFASDLRAELVHVPGIEQVRIVSVVNEPAMLPLPEVSLTLRQGVRDDYLRAARALGRLKVDVVLLQHEYGIFGGTDGDYVLSFARELAQPLVVTLHTVLSEPSPHQLHVLSAVCERAELVIVMTDTAARILAELRVCEVDKIRVVPHGAPALLCEVAGRRAARLPPGVGLALPSADAHTRVLLFTFGLLSPGKGLETAIMAMTYVVQQHPEVLYVIAGRTHPGVAEREGERYRLELDRRIAALRLGDHVRFDDRFLSIHELAALLAATDLFITPYGNREQIASGTLTFAIAAGCAVVSTPYRYAQDLLASGAGRLVPFDDPQALAQAICALLDDPATLAATRAEARRVGAALSWPKVAETTAAVLREAAARSKRGTPSSREVRFGSPPGSPRPTQDDPHPLRFAAVPGLTGAGELVDPATLVN